MIRKDFLICSVSTDTDIKAVGVAIDANDVPTERFELKGHVISQELVAPDSRLQIHINGQTFETVLTGCGRMYGAYITHFTSVMK